MYSSGVTPKITATQFDAKKLETLLYREMQKVLDMLNHSRVTQSVTDAWTDVIIANAVFNYMAWPVTKTKRHH